MESYGQQHNRGQAQGQRGELGKDPCGVGQRSAQGAGQFADSDETNEVPTIDDEATTVAENGSRGGWQRVAENKKR